jgi:hypothetical protein
LGIVKVRVWRSFGRRVRRVAVAAVERDGVVLAGLEGRHEETQRIGRLAHRARGDAAEEDDILRREPTSQHAHAGADGAAVDLERKHVAADNFYLGDFGVDLARRGHVVTLRLVVHEEVIRDLVAAGGDLILEFVEAAAEGARFHVEALPIGDDVRLHAGGRHGVGARRDAEGEGVNLGGILRHRRRGQVGERDRVATREQNQQADRGEAGKDFSRERNSVGVHCFIQ